MGGGSRGAVIQRIKITINGQQRDTEIPAELDEIKQYLQQLDKIEALKVFDNAVRAKYQKESLEVSYKDFTSAENGIRILIAKKKAPETPTPTTTSTIRQEEKGVSPTSDAPSPSSTASTSRPKRTFVVPTQLSGPEEIGSWADLKEGRRGPQEQLPKDRRAALPATDPFTATVGGRTAGRAPAR